MGPRFLAFHKPRRAGGPRFLARAGTIFSGNRMNVRPISVEGGFAMISRHEGLDLGALRTLSSRFSLGNCIREHISIIQISPLRGARGSPFLRAILANFGPRFLMARFLNARV